MTITASQVKELREITGVGMMECKEALVTTNGDMEKAIEELRKKGLAKAAKKADRETSEGYIKIDCEGSKCYVLSLTCETDFLAKSEGFQKLVSKLMQMLKDGKSIEEMEQIKQESVLELGENMTIKAAQVVEGSKIESYVHSNGKLAAVVVSKKSDTDSEKLKQVAMHITATNPEFLSTTDISVEAVEKEKAIQMEIMKNDPKMAGKPDVVLENILVGKMNKFKDEISLLEQAFVINPDLKVKQFIGEDNLEKFFRFSI
nr:translation elongation factor Ts [Candidatus Gracilibacteria bacterium]